MVKINYDSESFQQCSYSTLSGGTDNIDLAVVANEFVPKRNSTFLCCDDEISQNLQMELFFQCDITLFLYLNRGLSVLPSVYIWY